MYNKLARQLTLEELLEIHKLRSTEKEHKAFSEDVYQTLADLEETKKLMTNDMLQGISSTNEEKLIIKRYNKICRHYNKLMSLLGRQCMWL